GLDADDRALARIAERQRLLDDIALFQVLDLGIEQLEAVLVDDGDRTGLLEGLVENEISYSLEIDAGGEDRALVAELRLERQDDGGKPGVAFGFIVDGDDMGALRRIIGRC